MMNKKTLVAAFVLAMTQLSFGQTTTETTRTFGVRGNCGMCKATIEKAAKIPGVSSASWDVDKKEIKVNYDAAITDLKDIHKSIAKAGYDTDEILKSEKAYKNLHGCCQYDPNMEMGGEKKKKK